MCQAGTLCGCAQETEDLPHGKYKGVGICLAPLYSETPFMSDFLSWYTEMGVDHFYLYASINSWITDRVSTFCCST